MRHIYATILCIATTVSSQTCLIDLEVCDLGIGGGIGGPTCIERWNATLEASCVQDSDCAMQVHPNVAGELSCHNGMCRLPCHPGSGATNMFDILNFECHGGTTIPERHVCAAQSACSQLKIQQYNEICCGSSGDGFAPMHLAMDYLNFVCAHPISANLYR